MFANGDPVFQGNDISFTILGTGAIGAISPASGTNVGDATVTIAGAGFQSGAACELTSGSTTIVASAAVVNASGTSITCTLPLSGAATGAYNVVITNPGGAAIQDAGAFTVSGGSASQPAHPVLWTGIIVRPAIRTGVPSTLTITYGNSGTVDAYMAVVWIVMSSSLTYSTSGILSANDANCAVLSSLPIGYTLGSSTYIPLLIPILPAGSSYSLPLSITSPADSASLLFEDYTEPAWFDSLSNTNASLSAGSSSPGSVVQSCVSSASDPGIGNCFGVVAAALVPGVVSYFSAYGVTDLNAGSHVTSELASSVTRHPECGGGFRQRGGPVFMDADRGPGRYRPSPGAWHHQSMQPRECNCEPGLTYHSGLRRSEEAVPAQGEAAWPPSRC